MTLYIPVSKISIDNVYSYKWSRLLLGQLKNEKGFVMNKRDLGYMSMGYHALEI